MPLTSYLNLHVLVWKLTIPLNIIKITIEEGALNLVGEFLRPRLDIDLVQEWDFQKWKTNG